MSRLRLRQGPVFRKKQFQAPGPGIKAAQFRIQVIELTDCLVIKDLSRFSARKNLLAPHTDDPVGNLHREVNFMKRHHDSDSLFPGHFVKNTEKFQLMSYIKIRSGFIENNDLRLLADCAGQEDPLTLTVADGVKGPVRKMLRMNGSQRLLHLLLVRSRQDPKTSGIGISAHGGYIPAGHQFCLQTACQHDGHLLCQFSGAELSQAFHRRCRSCFSLCQEYAAADRRELAGDRLQDRRFSGSVGPDQCDDFPSPHTDLYSMDQSFPLIADGQMIKL